MVKNRAGILGTVLIIYGIVIFTSAWWVPDGNSDTAAYVFGFITVLLGIAIPAFLSTKE